MNRKKKSLALNRSTIRSLTSDGAARVQGGITTWTKWNDYLESYAMGGSCHSCIKDRACGSETIWGWC